MFHSRQVDLRREKWQLYRHLRYPEEALSGTLQ
jgi:hypothetical protein